MLHINDLNIKREIFPLLNYTLNSFAEEVLSELFQNIPSSIDAVNERQLILKGILKNWNIVKEYSYNKGDLPEIYHFLNRILEGTEYLPKDKLRSFWVIRFNKTKRSRLTSSVIQTVRMLYRLQNRYFTELNIQVFPLSFRSDFEILQHCFSSLELNKYEHKIIEQRFTVKDVCSVLYLLHTRITRETLHKFWQHLFLFEAYLSIAKAIQKYKFTFPEFHEEGFIIRDFYHPVLKNPVKNNLEQLSSNVMLITGANMSGKSTLLKSISLCVYMAHLGFGVPATICKIPFFDTISININHRDDIQNGYSHFMKEVLSLKEVVLEASASRKCFAVFDELFKGTNVEDAIAISETAIKGLKKFKQSYFIISTHLHLLKSILSKENVNVMYLDCKLLNGSPKFTYRLKEGWSDLKIGQLIFEQEGLNKLLS